MKGTLRVPDRFFMAEDGNDLEAAAGRMLAAAAAGLEQHGAADGYALICTPEAMGLGSVVFLARLTVALNDPATFVRVVNP